MSQAARSMFFFWSERIFKKLEEKLFIQKINFPRLKL